LNQSLKPKLYSKDRQALDRAVAQTPSAQLAVELGRTIAGLSKQMTAVVVPRFLVLCLKEFGLVRVDAGRFLAYFVSTGGVVQQRMVEMDFDLTQTEVTHIQNYLNTKLSHLGLSEIRTLLEKDLKAQRQEMNRLERSALEIGRKALPSDVSTDLTIDGASHLCEQPEFANTEKLQRLLKAVESKTALVTLLDRFLSDGNVTVVLNSEHNILEVPDLTCVGRALKTKDSGEKIASISVLGPARMDYGRVVPMINYASELLERQWIGV
jgi:heat-inducible transcriptional repressor